MTGAEQGFLLLCSQLGDPHRCPLTTAQLRTLTQRLRDTEHPSQERDIMPQDLVHLGYSREMAERIVLLLEDKELLQQYLAKAQHNGCVPLTRVTLGYPQIFFDRLGDSAPGCLWIKGDRTLLTMPCVSLVGSRDIRPENMKFAQELGRQAARQGYVLVSGNARGADRTAQQACLASGGRVISIVADELARHAPGENMLYMSEDGFDACFSAIRALSRNRLIHSLSDRTFVAQSSHRRGGTWDGTTRNLKRHWSAVFCFDDGSEASKDLAGQGAELVSSVDLHKIGDLPALDLGFFDQ